MFQRVKLSRLAIFVFLLPTLLLSACQTRYIAVHRNYYRVRVTNPRGEFVADYIAEGYVRRTERGYAFRAMERTSSMPYMMTNRYPRGRRVEVAGPNIVVTPSGKPEWLYHIDGY